MRTQTRLGMIYGYGYTDSNGDTKQVYLPHNQRNLGIHLVAAKGSGKSMLLGRYIAPAALQDKIPQVIFDNGDTIDHLLYQVSTWGKDHEAYQRIRYVDMAASQGFATPFPFYYRFGQESDYDVASRFVDVMRKLYPSLEAAQVQGWPLFEEAAQLGGLELVKRGWQITEIEQVLKDAPKVLTVRLLPFLHDERQRALYGASSPGIDWQKVIANGETVLLDFRHIHGISQKLLAVQWAFSFLKDLIDYRGIGATPLSVIIDELYDFTGGNSAVQHAFTADLQGFVNVTMRKHNIWLIVAHQTMSQFMRSPELQKLLTDLHTQIVGQVVDRDDAVLLARRLFTADPNKVKRTETRYDSYSQEYRDMMTHADMVRRLNVPLDEHLIDSPLHEQYHMHAQKLMDIEPLTFAVWKPGMPLQNALIEEKDLQRMIPFIIKWEEEGLWLDKDEIAAKRLELLKRDSRLIAEVLAEIEARTGAPTQAKETKEPATVKKLPVQTKGKLP